MDLDQPLDLSGSVALSRGLLHHKVWLREKFSFGQAWIDLILLASQTPREFTKRSGESVSVGVGQIYWSQSRLASRWGWSKERLSGFLRWLKNEGMIDYNPDPHGGTISLLQYEYFQTTARLPLGCQKDTARTPLGPEREKEKEGGGNRGGDWLPTDGEVLDFARDFEGELATGTPGPISEEFAAAWLARMLGRREFPPRWQRALIAEWRSACRQPNGGQKKNGAGFSTAPGSPEAPAWQQVTESRRVADLKRQLREAQEERDALDQCGAEVPLELKKRCRELARELEPVAA